jgi:hypothetical protein
MVASRSDFVPQAPTVYCLPSSAYSGRQLRIAHAKEFPHRTRRVELVLKHAVTSVRAASASAAPPASAVAMPSSSAAAEPRPLRLDGSCGV